MFATPNRYRFCLGALIVAFARPPSFSDARRVQVTTTTSPSAFVLRSRWLNRLDDTSFGHRDFHLPPRAFTLSASSEDGGGDGEVGTTKSSRSARERGIYSRPSAAIEKGSGFFIPGLEGSRVRFVFGIVVLAVDALNHFSVGGGEVVGDTGQIAAEALAAVYGGLLLLQALVEFGVEQGYANAVGDGSDVDAQNEVRRGGDESATDLRDAASSAPSGIAGRIRSASETIVRLTPATEFLFAVEGSGVVYSFGVGGDENRGEMVSGDEQSRLVSVALDAVYGSKGGRVALTDENPAAVLLPDSARRCMLLQRVEGGSERACFIVGSDRLLPSFTRNDLRWMGRLGEYVADARRLEKASIA